MNCSHRGCEQMGSQHRNGFSERKSESQCRGRQGKGDTMANTDRQYDEI